MKKKSAVIDTSYGSHEVIFEKDERRGYVATAPGLPGVITWGKSMIQVKEMAKEAIELCIESLVEAKSGAKERRIDYRPRRVLVHAGV